MHIRIVARSEHEADYVNRKGFHSLNVQMICNAVGHRSHLSARWPESVHNSQIIREMRIYREFEEGLNNLTDPNLNNVSICL